MKKNSLVTILCVVFLTLNYGVMKAQSTTDKIPADVYDTGKGELKVTLIGHGSIMFEYGGKVIYVDPYSKVADYSKLPKADLILITHEHDDHLDKSAIEKIKKTNTHFIVNQASRDVLGYGEVMGYYDGTLFGDIDVEAVPAYNIVRKNAKGEFYHPDGRGNGYILTFGDIMVYVAGDTEVIPEMDELNMEIEIAFLPKNLPYTMDDKMFVDAAKLIMPKYLYPYHYDKLNENKIKSSLKDTGIELVVRPMSNK